MGEHDVPERLSRISTVWTLVAEACGGPVAAAPAAQEGLLQRYQEAVYRYLLGAVRDADVADELFQEFALRFVRGDFRRADPSRGRFRDYVRRALSNLLHNYRSRQQRPGQQVRLDEPEALVAPEERFLETWRKALLDRVWEALAAVRSSSGPPLHGVLRASYESPGVRSAQLAEELTARLRPDRPFTAAGVRKALQRARERFADLLIDEVGRSIQAISLEEIEQELGDLGLLVHCRKAVARRRSGG